jgi:hypothetical protein
MARSRLGITRDRSRGQWLVVSDKWTVVACVPIQDFVETSETWATVIPKPMFLIGPMNPRNLLWVEFFDHKIPRCTRNDVDCRSLNFESGHSFNSESGHSLNF